MRNVIIIGRNYSSTLGLARSLGEAGYGVRLLALTKTPARIVGRSKYVNKTVCVDYDYFEENSAEEELRALEALRGDEEKMLVIPCRDITCLMLERHWDRLAEHFYFPNIRSAPGELERFTDKAVQEELAERCGLKAAGGRIYPTDEAGIRQACGEAVFPCITKPLSSSWSKGDKAFINVCHDPEELRSCMNRAREEGLCKRVLLERVLTIEHELSAYGVAANGQVWLPAVVRTIRSGLGIHMGVAAEGEVLPSDVLGDVKERVVRFVKESGLTGLFCVDLAQCGDGLYFFEINLRAGGSCYGVTMAGANLPGALADAVYHGRVDAAGEIREEVRFVSEFIDIDHFINGLISFGTLKKRLSGGQRSFIRNRDDPKPWRAARLYSLRVWSVNKVKKLLHRA